MNSPVFIGICVVDILDGTYGTQKVGTEGSTTLCFNTRPDVAIIDNIVIKSSSIRCE